MEKQLLFKIYCSHEKEILGDFVEGIELLEQLFPPIELRYITNPDNTLTKFKNIKNELLNAYQLGDDSICILHSDYKTNDRIHLTASVFLDFYETVIKNSPPPPAHATIRAYLQTPQTPKYIEYGYQILEKWAKLSNCFTAEAYTTAETMVCSKQYNSTPDNPPPYNLPALPNGPGTKQNVLIPLCFSWINYWSAEAAEYMDWSNDKAALFYRCERTQNGGLMLQLTKQPPNMELTEHQDILRNAYLAFPKVGGRFWAEGGK